MVPDGVNLGQPPRAPTAPLDGVRVLDLTSVIMGPLATQVLGDQGADVITLERHGTATARVMGAGPHPDLSGVALNLLRNKRNIAIDLGHPDGRAALLRVAADCDVFVTNLRPGSVGRLRLRYPDIASIRPDVIYCQAHGFPSDSPQADAPAFDDIIQAACGVPDVLRRAGGRPGLMPKGSPPCAGPSSPISTTVWGALASIPAEVPSEGTIPPVTRSTMIRPARGRVR
jgi:crotonobetainyl-CoA:carnitine CoA-transferase CaiB-like acyl-CoA transferase